MPTLTATEARSKLYRLIGEAASSHEPIVITGKRGSAVLISEDDWRSISRRVNVRHRLVYQILDDEILEKASRLTGVKEKTSLVRLGLEALIDLEIRDNKGMKMDKKTQKCIQCGRIFPETDGKYWIPQHAALPPLNSKYLKEPISGFRCKECDKKSKQRFYFFLLFIALLFGLIIIFSL